jgi:hypothetical protein
MRKIISLIISMSLLFSHPAQANFFTDLFGGLVTVVSYPFQLLLGSTKTPFFVSQNPFVEKEWHKEERLTAGRKQPDTKASEGTPADTASPASTPERTPSTTTTPSPTPTDEKVVEGAGEGKNIFGWWHAVGLVSLIYIAGLIGMFVYYYVHVRNQRRARAAVAALAGRVVENGAADIPADIREEAAAIPLID